MTPESFSESLLPRRETPQPLRESMNRDQTRSVAGGERGSDHRVRRSSVSAAAGPSLALIFGGISLAEGPSGLPKTRASEGPAAEDPECRLTPPAAEDPELHLLSPPGYATGSDTKC
ncbi:hypothetical protein UY3_02213 [Chelonia mydas]|uniref:Uncharacterized protein n=1 Tax=Chelonia mydas TaxID=8469 RepID=M7BXJ2_CHEMY|nr:hypothetical protein UY3_02213 [Chelonia mydas]